MLEGIGLIEKKSKNNIKWKGGTTGTFEEPQGELRQLQDEVAQLQVSILLGSLLLFELFPNDGFITLRLNPCAIPTPVGADPSFGRWIW